MAGLAMNENKPGLILLAMLLLGLVSACSQQPEAPPLAGAALGGPFTLTDQNGKSVSEPAYTGQYRLIYCGYTYCPDVCPVDLQSLAHGLRQFEEEAPERAAKVQPIFITTDPQRDTPAVLKDYVAAFHPRLIGLTGSPQQIAAVARKYGVAYSRRDDAGASDYLVDHSRIALLFGPEGEPIAIIPQDQGAAAIAAELERWVR